MSKTHYDTLLTGKIAKKYIDQMQWQMDCAGRQWCDFVSFDPRMPEGLDFFCKRVKRDDERIEYLQTEVKAFLEELNTQVQKIRGVTQMMHLMIAGNVGRDGEVRTTQSGKVNCSWSVAVDTGFGQNKTTTWVRCTMWGERGRENLRVYQKRHKSCCDGRA